MCIGGIRLPRKKAPSTGKRRKALSIFTGQKVQRVSGCWTEEVGRRSAAGVGGGMGRMVGRRAPNNFTSPRTD